MERELQKKLAWRGVAARYVLMLCKMSAVPNISDENRTRIVPNAGRFREPEFQTDGVMGMNFAVKNQTHNWSCGLALEEVMESNGSVESSYSQSFLCVLA